MNRKIKLVLIEWADSRQPTTAWERISEKPERNYCKCQSVGWLLQDDAEVKVLAANVADEGDEMQATGVITIPTVAVLAIKPLTSCAPAASKRTQRLTSRP